MGYGEDCFTSASGGRSEVPTGQQGQQLGRKPGCETGKHENKLELAKTNWESITAKEKLHSSHCLLLSMGKVAKKIVAIFNLQN